MKVTSFYASPLTPARPRTSATRLFIYTKMHFGLGGAQPRVMEVGRVI